MTTTVDKAFNWTTGATGRVLQVPALLALAPHVFTTRDVSFRGPSAPEEEERLAGQFALTSDRVVTVKQVHGRAVCVVQPGVVIPPTEADAIVSTDPGRAIAVRVADCVPILLADRQRRVVAAVHAGWRGTCAGAALAAVEAIESLGIPASELVAALGPSIGPCCYNVDERVRASFLSMTPASAEASAWLAEAPSARRRPDSAEWFAASAPGQWMLDLWRANVDQLLAAGVSRENIQAARYCTKDHPETCFSYRRDGPGTGRLVAAIQLTEHASE